MKSLRFLDRRSGYSLASIGLLLGMVVPSLVPAFASAGTLSTRSIELSSSAASATSVKYAITFTPTGASWQHLVIDWCGSSDGAIIGTACTGLGGGFDAKTGVTVTGGTAIGTASLNSSSSTATHTVIDGTAASTSTTPFTVTLNGVQNSSTVGTFYARMYTYNSSVNYTAADNLGSTVDSGAVALSTTQSIGVTAYVQESMTFCVSKADPSSDCGGVTAPSVILGEQIGTSGQYALDTGHVSTDTVHAQLSTNASGGAVVNMKSDAASCGGLYLNGDTTKCNILPQTTAGTGISIGQALFGVTVGSTTSATGATSPSGTLEKANGSGYDATHYYMNYVAGNSAGVTSTYGDPLLDTAGAPVNNKNVAIGLGASVNNTTAAGKYGANLSLIATGTF